MTGVLNSMFVLGLQLFTESLLSQVTLVILVCLFSCATTVEMIGELKIYFNSTAGLQQVLLMSNNFSMQG